MSKARWLSVGCAGLVAVGCAKIFPHHKKHAPLQPANEPATAPATQTVESEPASPEILQEKTQSYTETLQQLLKNPPATQPAIPPPSPAPPAAKPPAAPPSPTLEQVPAAPPPAVQVAINPPTTAPASEQASDGTQKQISFAQRIEQRAHDEPRDTVAQLDGQMLAFVRGRPVPDEDALSQLPAGDREVISALLDGLSNYRDVLASDPTATTTRKLQPLMAMSDRIGAQADLSIPVIALCSAVRGFGNYDTMNANDLPAGQAVRALVYCQIENFVSQMAGQAWETRFTERMALYSESTGQTVWSRPPQTITDRCRQRRHDCYCVELIDLPTTLPAGSYVLTTTLEDQVSNKLTQATLPITIK